MVFLRPLLGLIQGLLVYWFSHADFSAAGTIGAIVAFTFPLFAFQLKLPSRETVLQGTGLLIIMGWIYGYAMYHLSRLGQDTMSPVVLILTIQCVISALILLVFYCVAMEEKRFYFPYQTLFSEAWQLVLKILLAKLLILLTWYFFTFAAQLFKLIHISIIADLVESPPFTFIMPFFLFGIAMTILHQYEDILIKIRTVLLSFCYFLYPLLVVISLNFLLVAPFSPVQFADFWYVTIALLLINLLLFNGIFQEGLTKSPYPRWFTLVIYILFFLMTVYAFYILKFPLMEIYHYGFNPGDFLLLLLLLFLFAYHLSYSLAIFLSKKPWLDLIKKVNTIIALIIAFLYLVLALPVFDIMKLTAHLQLSRLLNDQPLINPAKINSHSSYLGGVNLQNANLAGKNLSHINFSKANLKGANLSQANLEGANLSQTNLIQANLNCANLQNANLSEANLTQARLSSANLKFAQLNKTNLGLANLAGANLMGASLNQVIFQQTNFTNADLNKVSGLTQENLIQACGRNVTLPDKLFLKPCTY
ncbi:pentapeptide repeat-containing protein [Legionella fairfieldensis]|uniref:pentapeptide repeat-containing protein n=1 Tax=Legionella fairfieldensis TaxID=45064 RepID=UPI000683DCB7|nr:pentapeptide repeat-containing protein [Legionella fairfieldensis]